MKAEASPDSDTHSSLRRALAFLKMLRTMTGKPTKNPKKPWYHAGLRFSCTACGECCKAHGAYSHVYADDDDTVAMAKKLSLTPAEFERRYAFFDDLGNREIRFENGACVFLKGGRCSVYSARPVQCRTFPFWPENLVRKVWKEEIERDCPGAGTGQLHSAAEIDAIAAESEA